MLIGKGPDKKVSQWFRGVGWVEPEFVRKLIDRIVGVMHTSFMANAINVGRYNDDSLDFRAPARLWGIRKAKPKAWLGHGAINRVPNGPVCSKVYR